MSIPVLLVDLATIRSAQSPPCNPRHEDVTMTLELTLSSFAWLTASATKRDIPSAVCGQPSVGSGKMKGHYIRTLDVVLLVLDAHDGAAASWSRRRCEVHECVCVVDR
ncbi:hypothetical protein EDB89DRAFT_2072599 [Lactarius sanguifluus]|nr:hypothetical protein EDB89DRAFT_2073825 [Lactarius sanguifluus]KAH9169741.1 hypothetical protein EDB89DRAFT_2072599 [Lactarius sanguifluus]